MSERKTQREFSFPEAFIEHEYIDTPEAVLGNWASEKCPSIDVIDRYGDPIPANQLIRIRKAEHGGFTLRCEDIAQLQRDILDYWNTYYHFSQTSRDLILSDSRGIDSSERKKLLESAMKRRQRIEMEEKRREEKKHQELKIIRELLAKEKLEQEEKEELEQREIAESIKRSMNKLGKSFVFTKTPKKMVDDLQGMLRSHSRLLPEIILKQPAELFDVLGSMDRTILHLAAWAANPEIVRLLLKLGANPFIKTKGWQAGDTALDLAKHTINGTNQERNETIQLLSSAME